MLVTNKQILSNVVMNTTINSAALNLLQVYGYAIQVTFTGTPTGTFKLQASCDPSSNLNPSQIPSNWTDIADSSFAVTAAGNYMWNIFEVMYNWVRLVYTDGSGGSSTAILTLATYNSKAV